MHETRRLLKVIGVAVTDFEAEAEKLKGVAQQLSGDTDKAEVAAQLKNVTELCSELNTRWLEVTQRVFQGGHPTGVYQNVTADGELDRVMKQRRTVHCPAT